MNENEIMNTETTVAEVNENPVVETQETQVTADNEVKSLGKDLAEMAVVGVIIYAFCKLCDWIIDRVKAGIKKFKENRAAKKAAKAAQAQQAATPEQGKAPVANVEIPADGQATEQK